MTNTRGDSHPKAGRPKTNNPAIRRQMRFTDAEWAQLTLLGRAKWIRQQLLLAKEKS